MVRMLLLFTIGIVSLRKVSGRVHTHGYVFPLLFTAADLGTEIIANSAFARGGGASRGLARTAAPATGLKWPIMAFARSTIP
jgi:hypothetical protein